VGFFIGVLKKFGVGWWGGGGGGGNWLNAGRFKYLRINAGGYSSAMEAGNVSYPDTE